VRYLAKIQEQQAAQQLKVQGVPLPAPVGGWDAISPLANMPIDRAYLLDNWIPRPGWIEPRPGYAVQATGVGDSDDPVETVMAYNGSTAANKVFAVAAGTIYDCTKAGSPAVATTVTGLANSRLQYKMFGNVSDNTQWLTVCNGANTPKKFDGTSWSDVSISGSGFDVTKFIDVAVHKGRIWYAEKGQTYGVYLNTVGGVEGAATVFPLGPLMTKGGVVESIGTWTIDTRQTVDEYIAFISSRGQVMVYQGTDPTTAQTWSLVGVYTLGAPIGRRCYLRISGDLLIITLDGVVPMSQMLSTDRAAANRVSLTSIIMNEMAKSARAYQHNFGWQLIEYPRSTIAILNIPQTENAVQFQYVMNTITGAWARFIGRDATGAINTSYGINANCWEVDSQDLIYFGGNDGTLYQWDNGQSDNGNDITCLVKTAYNNFGNAAQVKRYTALQPLITTNNLIEAGTGINVDFNDTAFLSVEQDTAQYVSWDEVNWNEFDWPNPLTVRNDWIAVAGVGHYVSIVTQLTVVPNQIIAPVIQLNGWNITAETGMFV
jgi:hypothetical protein